MALPTVEEVLKSSGWTDEQITALDAKAKEAFAAYGTKIITTAEEANNKAALALRANQDLLNNEINPRLDTWANEKATLEMQLAAYKTAVEQAKAGGFSVPEIKVGEPAKPDGERGADGRYVAGGNQVPGSPSFEKFRDGIAMANAAVWDISHKYRTLFGSEMPDPPSALIAEAERNHMSPVAWAAQKYNFKGKEDEITVAKQKAHDDAIVKEATERVTREMTEKFAGNNPALRPAVSSEFSKMQKGVDEKSRPDPTMLSREQRHQITQRNIQKEIAENTVQ